MPSLAPIEQLPHEIHTKILRHTLPTDNPHAFVRTIAAFRVTSKALHDGPPKDEELWLTSGALSLLGQAVTQHVDGAEHLADEDICGLSQVLGLLSPGRRADVAQAAINMLADGPRPRAIGGLGPGLAHLPQALRDDLFDAAVDLPGDDDKAWALGGLAKGLGFLEETRARALVDSLLELPDGTANKGHAIAALAPQLAQLPQDQRAGLVQAAVRLAIEEDRARALAALAAELAHLDPSERHAVGQAVDQFLAGQHQAEAICGLCRSAETLDETQIDLLAQEVLGINGPARGKGLGALGAALARLGQDRRNEVFGVAMQLDAAGDTAGKCLAIRGLGVGLASLTAAQRQTLVMDTVNLPHMQEKALAIAGLAAAAAPLSEGQRGRLVDAALNLPEDAWRGDAIGSLGACLDLLHANQHEALVAAAIACTGLDQRARAIAGLAQGWPHLTQPQRHALTTAAAGLGDTEQWRAIAALAREGTKPLPA
jgi:hypothetical protein